MKVTITTIFTSLLLLAWAMQSFKTDSKTPTPVHPLKQVIPDGFPRPVYTFKNNPLTQEGFEVGKKLFYEGRMAKDSITSCASCHQQFAAFAELEHNLSHGFNNAFSLRNAPSLFNLAWQKEFHLDGGINHIEVQPLAPITDPNEMAETMESIIAKLKTDTAYRRMFREAFGDERITSQRILKALTQFTGSLVSATSKYDRMKKGKYVFTEFENKGYQIYLSRCASCHTEPLFTDLSYRNIGLAVDSVLKDYGRMRITKDPKDSLKFKVPSLRNVTRSSPYMHDGRFWGIAVSLNHFQAQKNNAPSLDTLISNGKPLDRNESQYVLSFLYALEDSSFLNDKRFAESRRQ